MSQLAYTNNISFYKLMIKYVKLDVSIKKGMKSRKEIYMHADVTQPKLFLYQKFGFEAFLQ